MSSKEIRHYVMLLLCMTLVLPAFAQENANHPPLITVQGTAEVAVAPDRADLTLGIDSRDKDLLAAKAENDRRIKKLLALARAEGIEPKYIQTSRLSMEAEFSEEKIPKLIGYEVSQTVTLTLTDLTKYEELMTQALYAGVNRVGGIEFYVAHPQKYREEARLKALQAAHDKAEAMAAKLGQKIGKAWEIREGSAPGVYGATANTFIPTRSRRSMNDEDATISSGEITIDATVTVSFLLE